jgi:2,5-furandicarboxylate decarboxylase 1
MDQSLRGFLRTLEVRNDLRRVAAEVSPVFEIGAALLQNEREAPRLFEHVAGYRMPIVGNVLNTRERIALGLGIDRAGMHRRLLDALDGGIAPALVRQGAVQERTFERPDIGALLPVPHWFEKERGPYITAGVVIAKHPETGRRNVSIARFRLEGGNRLMAGIAPTHHLARLLAAAGERGKELEIAIVIGNHPATLIASQMYVELGRDEYDIAGALLGEPLRLVRCKTIDVEVPAEAEIVLEGRLVPNRQIVEGPVSEFPGFYVEYGRADTAEIDCITTRADPVYQAIVPGYSSEHLLLGAVAIEATTSRALQRVIPSVRRVVVTEGGAGRLHAIISMHRPARGEGKRAVLLAMGTLNLLKLVVCVEDDIDPEDWRQVEWSLGARFEAGRDMVLVPGVKSDRCEPQHQDLTVTKMGLIATTRPGDGEPGSGRELARPPQAITERMRTRAAEL